MGSAVLPPQPVNTKRPVPKVKAPDTEKDAEDPGPSKKKTRALEDMNIQTTNELPTAATPPTAAPEQPAAAD